MPTPTRSSAVLAVRHLTAVACLAILLGGCNDVGGGVQIEPDVSIKVDELDDEDVAILEGSEAGSIALPVRSPSGAVIAPPEQRDE